MLLMFLHQPSPHVVDRSRRAGHLIQLRRPQQGILVLLPDAVGIELQVGVDEPVHRLHDDLAAQPLLLARSCEEVELLKVDRPVLLDPAPDFVGGDIPAAPRHAQTLELPLHDGAQLLDLLGRQQAAFQHVRHLYHLLHRDVPILIQVEGSERLPHIRGVPGHDRGKRRCGEFLQVQMPRPVPVDGLEERDDVEQVSLEIRTMLQALSEFVEVQQTVSVLVQCGEDLGHVQQVSVIACQLLRDNANNQLLELALLRIDHCMSVQAVDQRPRRGSALEPQPGHAEQLRGRRPEGRT
mmetsp:Transcript_155099/g.497299  ORF Transcript_155099/g.497299 Transcript_155099/m.497299 type:complete len:295 (-) Transcript_155099:1082-1966(-)